LLFSLILPSAFCATTTIGESSLSSFTVLQHTGFVSMLMLVENLVSPSLVLLK